MPNVNKYDIIVCGLGGMGSATVSHLAERGIKVFGFDRFHPPHTLGSSHGQSRIIRQAYFESPAYVPMLFRAYQLWEKLSQDHGKQLFNETGCLMVGEPDGRVIAGSKLSAETYGIPHEILTAAEIRDRYPPFQPADNLTGIFEKKGGTVNPEEAIRAHLENASRHNAHLGFEETFLEWKKCPGGSGIEVLTDKGRYQAEKLIITAGPWAAKLFPDLRLPIKIERLVLHWFQPDGGTDPFLPDRFPVHIWKVEDGTEFYGFPYDGEVENGVKVAIHNRGTPCDPDSPDREVSEADIDQMRTLLAGHIPSLAGKCLHSVVCLYSQSPEGDFILGPHPHSESEDLVLGIGFSGHGYKFCPVIGEILADLATTGATRFDLSPFCPTRWINSQSA